MRSFNVSEQTKLFVQNFMNLDADDLRQNASQITVYMNAAYQYLIQGGCDERLNSTPLFMLAVALLTAHYYDNGMITTDVNNQPLKYSLSYIIQQLKYCGDDE